MNRFHGIAAIVASMTVLSTTFAQYKPGQVVEYNAYGTWERGVVVELMNEGKQFKVRMKEAPGGTKGGETRTFWPVDLRPVRDDKPQPEVPMVKPVPMPEPVPTIKPLPMPNPDRIVTPGTVDPKKPITVNPGAGAKGQGLMTKENVLAYLNEHLPDPRANLDYTWEVRKKLGEELKKRGSNFLVDTDFYNELWKRGANVTTVFDAIANNYGHNPTVEDYHGTYLLRGAKRGVKTLSKDGTKLIQTTADAQSETGAITINKDGTFVWKLFRTDSEDKWVKGKWRVAKDGELQETEGGPVLILEKAQQGQDYYVRKSRIPNYEGWIDVGMGKGRTGIHYGRPAQ